MILDNGAYEGQQVSNEDLASLAMFMKPTFVVAPDKPNMSSSIHHSVMFQLQWGSQLKAVGVKTMAIIHCDPRDQWNLMINRYSSSFEYLGISRLSKIPMSRAEVARRLIECGTKYVHAFGYLGKKDLLECAEAGVESLDTSAPIWRGLCGIDIDPDSTRKQGKWEDIDIPVNFDATWDRFPAVGHNYAALNLQEVDKWLQSETLSTTPTKPGC